MTKSPVSRGVKPKSSKPRATKTSGGPNWTPLEDVSPKAFQAWLERLDLEPYRFDPVLQEIPWVREITKAIQAIEGVLGEDDEREFAYWSSLHEWRLALNTLSIARAIGALRTTGLSSWQGDLENLRAWLDGGLNDRRVRPLIEGGSILYDALEMFSKNPKFSNPIELARKVLAE